MRERERESESQSEREGDKRETEREKGRRVKRVIEEERVRVGVWGGERETETE